MYTELLPRYADQISALPDHTPLTRTDLLTTEFLLERDGDLELYFAPFEHVEPGAKVALVGITPGWYQTEMALRTARNMLHSGATLEEAGAHARRAASFSGPIRRTLVGMLDGLGLNTALGITSSWELWDERHELLHTTALVRYPLFVGGQNYTGYKPDALKTPLIRSYITNVLAAELARIPDALVVPLGRSVAQGLLLLEREGHLDSARLLPGLPHPSGANAHRHTQYAAIRDQASAALESWFRSKEKADTSPQLPLA